jgi:predicted nucleotidyltransferase
MNLPEDPFIRSLIARLIQPGVIGVAVAGSYSRGEQNQYSDVDVDIFVDALPEKDMYTLHIFDGKLVSLKYVRVQDEFSSLKKPEKAIWAVHGLKQMQILLDETGQLAKLKQAAYDFDWAELQDAANKFAVESLAGCSEEAHKIIDGLLHENESKVLYAAWGMFKNLSFAAAVQAGLMIESENKIFSMMQDHFNNNHAWVRAFRLSFGMDVNPELSAYQTRGRAALDLYEQTALLFENIVSDKHRELIENTLQLISSYKQSYQHE